MSASAQKTVFPADLANVDDVHADTARERRILLVDEQAHVLRVMRLNLERQGYIVDTALNSENVMLLMSQYSYNALIVTSDMPDMSTRQLCENAVRYYQATVPIILVHSGCEDGWVDRSDVVERLGAPISLQWIVGRLGQAFDDNAS